MSQQPEPWTPLELTALFAGFMVIVVCTVWTVRESTPPAQDRCVKTGQQRAVLECGPADSSTSRCVRVIQAQKVCGEGRIVWE